MHGQWTSKLHVPVVRVLLLQEVGRHFQQHAVVASESVNFGWPRLLFINPIAKEHGRPELPTARCQFEGPNESYQHRAPALHSKPAYRRNVCMTWHNGTLSAVNHPDWELMPIAVEVCAVPVPTAAVHGDLVPSP